MDSVTTVNTSQHLFNRQFFLDKIKSEIQPLEDEFHTNMWELEQIQDKIWDLKPGTRNKKNPVYHKYYNRRSKLNHRNETIQKQLIRLHEEYKRYETIDM